MSTAKKLMMAGGNAIPEIPGEEFGGGYYAGKISISGVLYALVVAPKALGQSASGLQWDASNDGYLAGADTKNDGLSSTLAMVAAGNAARFAAAHFCNNLVINGYDDWYLPSQHELEICYRSFKPTTEQNTTADGGRSANSSAVPPTVAHTAFDPLQTSVIAFRAGNSEAFNTGVYWSSTQGDSSAIFKYAFFQQFSNGYIDAASKAAGYSVRAVRRVAIQ